MCALGESAWGHAVSRASPPKPNAWKVSPGLRAGGATHSSLCPARLSVRADCPSREGPWGGQGTATCKQECLQPCSSATVAATCLDTTTPGGGDMGILSGISSSTLQDTHYPLTDKYRSPDKGGTTLAALRQGLGRAAESTRPSTDTGQ